MTPSDVMEAENIVHPNRRSLGRRTLLVSAGMILSGALIHALLLGAFVPGPLLVQVFWSASLALLGLAYGSGRLPQMFASAAAGLVCSAALAAIISFTGGPDSPYFGIFIAVPLLISMFTPEEWGPTLVALGGMIVAVVGVNMRAGVPLQQCLPQAFIFGLVGSLGLYGGRTYCKLRAAERAAQADRLKALEQLAESERHRRRAESERAEAERLMMVGQLASGVAHEVNNPLAFVKSNLHYLEREWLESSTPPDMAEMREVMSETLQGVLRIQQIVAELQRFSRLGGNRGSS